MTTDELAAAFLAGALPKSAWTHEAHLRVALWHVLRYGPAEALDRMRQGIRAYNQATGVVNSDTGGYHETITRFYVGMIETFVRQNDTGLSQDILADRLVAQAGDRELPLRFYSRARLDSVAARRHWVEPDVRPLDFDIPLWRTENESPPSGHVSD